MTDVPPAIPRPANERDRLAALLRPGILDTPPEERFDRIVRLATRLSRVPFSFISLIDAKTQWIKAREGACPLPSSRERSFCGHTILTNKMMIVPDAGQDPRFAREKRRSDELLRNVLPDHIADELLRTGGVKPQRHERICVLFCDFSDFTGAATVARRGGPRDRCLLHGGRRDHGPVPG